MSASATTPRFLCGIGTPNLTSLHLNSGTLLWETKLNHVTTATCVQHKNTTFFLCRYRHSPTLPRHTNRNPSFIIFFVGVAVHVCCTELCRAMANAPQSAFSCRLSSHAEQSRRSESASATSNRARVIGAISILTNEKCWFIEQTNKMRFMLHTEVRVDERRSEYLATPSLERLRDISIISCSF
jgi:hypothetical protein